MVIDGSPLAAVAWLNPETPESLAGREGAFPLAL